MAMTGNADRGQRSSINVTPLIDVLLVLLIIFMVIQPEVRRGLDALVPEPPHDLRAEPSPRTLVVTVNGTAALPQYALNGQRMPLEGLQASLQELFAASGQRALFVQGAADLDYSAVAGVFNAAHAAGAEEIGVLTPATLSQ